LPGFLNSIIALFHMRIAVLLTTFNRKEKTIACLKYLYEQVMRDDIRLDLFLTDDASPDGTAEAVKDLYPVANIFHGNGSLFWAGGMRNSWTQALAVDPDYYLLLNDDTFLYPDAVERLIQTSEEALLHSHAAVCIGTTKDADSGTISYGGRKLYSGRGPGSYVVHSETGNLECDLGNANIMLVPRMVVKKIGILSPDYIHGIADYDYTLRAKKAGFKVLVSRGILGTCKRDHGKNWKSSGTRLKERINYLYSPKGLAYKEYLFFIRKHFPLYLPSAFFKLWLKTLFPIFYDTFKK
jgi:GT2 family glycosyltransferase